MSHSVDLLCFNVFMNIISPITLIQLNIVRDELNLVRTSINQIIEAKVLVDEVLASSQANVQSLRRQIHYFNDFEFRLEQSPEILRENLEYRFSVISFFEGLTLRR